jgi:hypothetical protein
MSWQELLGQEILIRLPDNDIGFVYVVKYGGITVRRGFVSAMNEDRGERGALFAWREATEEDTPDGEEGDAG